MTTLERSHHTDSSYNYRQRIVQKTLGEMRTFLDEIANETSNYKSLHNLTEQVEHQYHGRFLIELIQNAHDALLEREEEGDERRIELCIEEGEAPFGALYIANEGNPFSLSNFESLSNLGQSDKDPEKSIGNKGIGFRSVLEISKSPEVYSRSHKESPHFDGFCFRFNPSIIHEFGKPIHKLMAGNDHPASPIDPGTPLVLWSDEKYKAFRERCIKFEEGWLQKELSYLSPYLLPETIEDNKRPPKILEYEKEGYASVIRLPFIGEKARDSALVELENLHENTVLFLDRVKIFKLTTSQYNRTYIRSEEPRENDPEQGFEVFIIHKESAHGTEPVEFIKRFWLWEKYIGNDDDPKSIEKLKTSVADLPGKWPELTRARIAFAVKIEEEPEKGVLNIYLPTDLPSGCSAHFSAPFYGDMSRTYVDFNKPYNKLLLRSIAEKVTDVIFNCLVGMGNNEAAAIIDLISYADDAAGERWWSTLSKFWEENDINIGEQEICLTDRGWDTFKRARLLSVVNKPEVLNAELIRQSVCYPTFVDSLSSRSELIKRVYAGIYVEPYAMEDQLADSIEKAAKTLHSSVEKADWNGFWHDVEKLLEGDSSLLKGKDVLLGTDGQLHASGANSAVFFRPLKLGTDDEVESEDAIDEIPENLRSYIAFLHESITTHTTGERGGHDLTRIHRFLSTDLVKRFGIEQILRNVLIPAVPAELPVPLQSERGKLCRDILQWGLKLILSLVSRDKGERLTGLLSRLPAPCNGGWYRLNETTFGPGWDDQPYGSVGKDLDSYLKAVATSECMEEYKRLLLPPGSKEWRGMVEATLPLLRESGVSRGLRPKLIDKDDWSSKFWISGYSKVDLPESAPPVFWKSCWNDYRTYISNELEPRYSGSFQYVVNSFYSLPGLDHYGEFDDNLRLTFMRILLASIPFEEIQGKWESMTIQKPEGEKHNFKVKSPLKFFLEQTAWLVASQEGSFDCFRPKDRWFIPSTVIAGRFHHYDHLKPLPVSIVSIFERHPIIPEVMEGLGMPLFDLEKQTSDTRLLRNLASALIDPEIDIASKDVFLGMVRNAWSQFYPEEGDDLPSALVVRRSTSSLETLEPSEAEPVFLPDATEALHEGLELYSRPIIAIESRDAKRLKAHFLESFREKILLASELTMRPLVDGEPWDEGSAPLLTSTGLEWLPPVVLAIFAYAGQQNRGTGTKTFLKAIDVLRGARLLWVESLEVGLWNKNIQVANVPLEAFWHSQNNVMLSEMEGMNKVSILSEALAAAVERADLPVYLKVVLGKLSDNNEPPSQKEICEALKEVGISQDRFIEVQQRWLGNLSWTIKILRPIIHLLNPEADTATLAEINTDLQMEMYLKALELTPLGWEKALEIAQTSTGLRHTGEKLFDIVGENAQLERWNSVLISLGETPVEIPEIKDQFRQHLDSVRKPFRAVIRRILKDDPTAGPFVDLEDRLYDISCPEDWIRRFWIVEFQMAMKEVEPLLKEIGVLEDEINIIINAKSVADLVSGLSDLGLEPQVDPLNIHSDNIAEFQKAVSKLQKIAIVWCENNKVSPLIWEGGIDVLMDQFEDYLGVHAFLDEWDESECLRVFLNLKDEDVYAGFCKVVDGANSIVELMDLLGITEQDLLQADESLKRQRERKEKEKRMVKVCGQPFDNASDNLVNLWDHLDRGFKDKEFSDLDINKWPDLKEQKVQKKKHTGKKKSGRKRGSPPKRMTQAMKNLAGLAGEIFVYRLLQKTFGEDVISPDCWISENSKHKFPQNRTDDSYGCDFEFCVDGKKHFIEVKASTGEDEIFELGSSEIQLAVELANKRNDIFSIIHVMNVLSNHPEFQRLPNPYSKRYRAMYRIEDAGLRIRYET